MIEVVAAFCLVLIAFMSVGVCAGVGKIATALEKMTDHYTETEDDDGT